MFSTRSLTLTLLLYLLAAGVPVPPDPQQDRRVTQKPARRIWQYTFKLDRAPGPRKMNNPNFNKMQSSFQVSMPPTTSVGSQQISKPTTQQGRVAHMSSEQSSASLGNPGVRLQSAHDEGIKSSDVPMVQPEWHNDKVDHPTDIPCSVRIQILSLTLSECRILLDSGTSLLAITRGLDMKKILHIGLYMLKVVQEAPPMTNARRVIDRYIQTLLPHDEV